MRSLERKYENKKRHLLGVLRKINEPQIYSPTVESKVTTRIPRVCHQRGIRRVCVIPRNISNTPNEKKKTKKKENTLPAYRGWGCTPSLTYARNTTMSLSFYCRVIVTIYQNDMSRAHRGRSAGAASSNLHAGGAKPRLGLG